MGRRRRNGSADVTRLGVNGFDDLAGGVEGRGGGQACAGMRAGAAEEEAANGCAIAGPTDERAHGEKLIEGEFAVGDVAARQTVGLLEIQRRDDAAGEDSGGQVGGVLRESFDDNVSERVAVGGPIAGGGDLRG